MNIGQTEITSAQNQRQRPNVLQMTKIPLSPELIKLAEIFFPNASSAQKAVVANGTRFVHYTSAPVAVSIIQKSEICMRNAKTMNDFSEIEYGQTCLRTAYQGPAGENFRNALNAVYENLSVEIENLYNNWFPHIQINTYLTCLSEHLDIEDNNGRLSMWRAYGGTTGIALVVRNTPFVAAFESLVAYSSPLAYITPVQFAMEMGKITKNILDNMKFLKNLNRADIVARVFSML